MTLDEMNNAMPPEELKEWNEKNLEGRIERIWIFEKNEEMQNSTSEENEELLHFETREEKILELHRQNLDELLKKELNHEESPWRTPISKHDDIEWRMKE